MVDVEKVIKHMELYCKKKNVPFVCFDAMELLKEQKDRLIQMEIDNVDLRICYEELLKEQEAVKPIRKLAYTKQGWFCGNCDNRLNRNGKYCSFCGKPILWEGR